MLSSILIMLPLMMVSERFGYRKFVFVLSIALITLSQFSLGLLNLGYAGLAVALIIFFGAFNMLEASLPSWVSRIAEPNSKGTALGVYSTSQYLGTFVGGVAGAGSTSNIRGKEYLFFVPFGQPCGFLFQ